MRIHIFEALFVFVVWLLIAVLAIGAITGLVIGLNAYRAWLVTLVPEWQATIAFAFAWIVVLLATALCTSSIYANMQVRARQPVPPTGRVKPASPPTREAAPAPPEAHEALKAGPSSEEVMRRGYGYNG